MKRIIFIENAYWKGTKMNCCSLYVNNRNIGTIDHDHKKIVLDENYGFNREKLAYELANFDSINGIDLESAYNDYLNYDISIRENDDEE